MPRVVAAAVLILTAGWWTFLWANGRTGIDAQVAAGGEVILSLYDVVGVSAPDIARVDKGGRVLTLVGVPADLAVGDAISAGAIPQPDGTFRVTWLEEKPGRRGKRLLGVVGLAGALVVTALGVRVRDGGVQLRA